jgi:hypothetical protein
MRSLIASRKTDLKIPSAWAFSVRVLAEIFHIRHGLAGDGGGPLMLAEGGVDLGFPVSLDEDARFRLQHQDPVALGLQTPLMRSDSTQ